MPRLHRIALTAAIAASLVWAAVEARHLGRRESGPARPAASPFDPGAVEAAFAELLAARDAGRREEIMLDLRGRAEHGPYAGYAWFLLGEMAYQEGAYRAALRHYRKAVEVDPSVADRDGALASARMITARSEALLHGPWAKERPPEIRDLYYLQRRLAGGCE
jgi:cytochrome c-type biogenesis protein CcmH/NrfG